MAMYNLDDQIIANFARASFNYGLERGYPVHVDQEHDPQEVRRRFKDIFQEIFEAEFKADKFEKPRTSPTSTA